MLNQELTGRQPLCVCSLHQSQTQANSTVHLNLERKLSRSLLLLVKTRLPAVSICLLCALHPVQWKNAVQPFWTDGVVLRGKYLIAQDSQVKVRTIRGGRATRTSEMPFNVTCVNHLHFNFFFGHIYGCRSLLVPFLVLSFNTFTTTDKTQ